MYTELQLWYSYAQAQAQGIKVFSFNPDKLDGINMTLTNSLSDNLSRFNNSCLKLPASTLVDLTFQSRALRSFSLNQLRDLSL